MAIAPACLPACLLTWPDRPLLLATAPAGFPLSIAPPPAPAFPLSARQPPAPALHISQLKATSGNVWVRKNLLKLIGICKKLMILQFCIQPSFACWYFCPNRNANFSVAIHDYWLNVTFLEAGLICIFIFMYKIFFLKNCYAYDYYEAILHAGTHWPGSQSHSGKMSLTLLTCIIIIIIVLHHDHHIGVVITQFADIILQCIMHALLDTGKYKFLSIWFHSRVGAVYSKLLSVNQLFSHSSINSPENWHQLWDVIQMNKWTLDNALGTGNFQELARIEAVVNKAIP